MRDGYGAMLWGGMQFHNKLDGAKYEGEWRENRANGKGAFWHIDGDTCILPYLNR